MILHMELGNCYRAVFGDGTDLQFRYVGKDPEGRPLIVSPPEGGRREVMRREDVVDFYEIDVPRGEMEEVGV